MVDVEQPIRPDSKAAEEMYRVMFMFTTFIIVFFNPDHGPYPSLLHLPATSLSLEFTFERDLRERQAIIRMFQLS